MVGRRELMSDLVEIAYHRVLLMGMRRKVQCAGGESGFEILGNITIIHLACSPVLAGLEAIV